VGRLFLAICFAAAVLPGQQQPPPDKKPPLAARPQQAKPDEVEPPEEDESLIPETCVLNPLEAARNMTAGNFYFKKGNYRAAANRYKRAACWDPSSAEAFLKLGESDEKMRDRDGARDAYQKYLAAAPDAKNTAEIKKKLAKLSAKK
jgi:tetratricopeptide (TPR) repeat protein